MYPPVRAVERGVKKRSSPEGADMSSQVLTLSDVSAFLSLSLSLSLTRRTLEGLSCVVSFPLLPLLVD